MREALCERAFGLACGKAGGYGIVERKSILCGELSRIALLHHDHALAADLIAQL